ncbi:hypothetical protein NCPPB940_22470 [Xanthomonas hortorum pv. taraxaci]|nr:hypothetical protein NCPPB940_22470 [Xanthomonas hortorum pv. taraxaci]CAD0331737.1 hypothetical protein NCPPB940_22470 [Xanthomonas hortorum pv. taraxaci]
MICHRRGHEDWRPVTPARTLIAELLRLQDEERPPGQVDGSQLTALRSDQDVATDLEA